MILTDGIHLISDVSIAELHEFAAKVGIKRCWFHNRRGKHRPHYDITNQWRREKLLDDDTVKWVSSKEIVTTLKKVYEPN
jgi:hypothetical protein